VTAERDRLAKQLSSSERQIFGQAAFRKLNARCDAAEVERDRMREALVHIADVDAAYSLATPIDIAREALNPTADTGGKK
jgi:hypothetical protein